MTVECIECIENDARMNDKTMMCPWKENHRRARARIALHHGRPRAQTLRIYPIFIPIEARESPKGATVLSSLRRATARAIDRDRARPHTRAIDMTAVKRANRCATVAVRCARSPRRRPRRARDARRVHARANLECDCPAGRREK